MEMPAKSYGMTKQTEWPKAWKALRGLVADPERTDLVFEIIDALAGLAFERAFTKFRNHPDGQRLLAERPSLLETLSNSEVLAEMPAGSLGRAYADFMKAGQLSAQGLLEAEQAAIHDEPQPIDVDRQFFGDRLRDMHDLWHVLTGYGRDEAGEAANLAFTVAQIPSRGVKLIVVAAAAIGPKLPNFAWQRYLLRAWKRGRRATMLSVVRYEELLALPLDDVRAQLGIDPPEVAHPLGVVVASRADMAAAVARYI